MQSLKIIGLFWWKLYYISYNMHPRAVHFPLSNLKNYYFFLTEAVIKKNPVVGTFVHIKSIVQALIWVHMKAISTSTNWREAPKHLTSKKAETCLQAAWHEPNPSSKLCLGMAQEEQGLEQLKFTPGHTSTVCKYWIPVLGNVCSVHEFIWLWRILKIKSSLSAEMHSTFSSGGWAGTFSTQLWLNKNFVSNWSKIFNMGRESPRTEQY